MHHGLPSITALSAARHRATHQVVDGGVVFRDPLAVRIVGDSESDLRSATAAHPERRAMRWFICARSRFAEDCLAFQADRGASQLVVLGAGLDTFGYRHEVVGLRVVEIDHPATQRWKRGVLATAGIDSSTVAFRGVDFEHEDLASALIELLDPDLPVMVWWLGVTPYLTIAAIRTTLAAIGQLPRVTLVLDHASPVTDVSPHRRPALEGRRARVAALGEPWLSEFRPSDIAVELRAAGFERTVPVDERDVITEALAGVPNVAARLLGPARDVRASSHLMFASRGLDQ